MKSLTHNSPALEAMKTSLNNLRERIQEAARCDTRFTTCADGSPANTNGPCCCWVDDVLEDEGKISAIITAADGKCYECACTCDADGKCTLGDCKEVVRQTSYTPVAAESAAAPIEDEPLTASQCPNAIECLTSADLRLSEDGKEIHYMRAGVQTITPNAGAPLGKVAVNITRAGVKALNAQLECIRARGKKPYFDFNHEKGAASFHPTEFVWRDDPKYPGIYALGTPTKAGREGIEGGMWTEFSGRCFLSDHRATEKKPATIICNPDADPNMGGFVNNGAFSGLKPLAASQKPSPAAGAAGATQTNKNGAPALPHTMKTAEQIQSEKAALEARNTQLETRITELEAKDDAVAKAQLEAARAEKETLAAKLANIALEAKAQEYEAREQKRKETEADAAVEAMKSSGQIPMLDKEAAATYRAKFIADPTLIPLVVNRKGNGALEAGRRTTPGSSIIGYGDVKEGATNVLKAIASQLKNQLGIRGMGAVECKRRGDLALEAAMIYEKEILSTALDAEGMRRINADYIGAPLEAATDADTLGTLAGTLVAMRALQFFKYKLPVTTRITTDFSDVPAFKGQTVNTRKITAASVQSYDSTLGADGRPNGWSTASAATTVDVNVSLDELVGVPIPLSMATIASTNRNLFGEAAPAAYYSLAKYFVDKIYALFTTANYNGYAAVTAKVPTAYASYPVALVDFARSKVAEIGAAFDWNEVPEDERTLILNPSYYSKGTTDPSLVNFFAGQQNPEIITRGVLPQLNDFALIKAGNFPQTNNRVGMALQKNGVVALTRLPGDYATILPGANNGSVTQVTEPETGISVLLVQYVNHKQGYAEWLICVLLGAAVGDKRGGLVLTSQ